MTSESKARIERLSEQRQALLLDLSDRPMGLSWCSRLTELADDVIRLLYVDLLRKNPGMPPLAIIATGGYGRRELSPYSDIDVTVVPSDEASSVLDPALRELFQDLHQAFTSTMGLQVGYAYRLISDAPGLDAKTRTGLMDMRHVAGSFELYRALEEALIESFAAGEFLLSKITEREAAFAKYHDTPFVVEPHLKEGAGGLRSFHCANWIREAIGERPARPPAEYDTIVKFRNLLHLRAGKAQDHLSRSKQSEIADHLDLDVYAMMSDLVCAGSVLHDYYVRATEKVHEARFALSRNVLAVGGEARIFGNPDAGEAAVGIAFATKLGLKVSDIPTATPTSVDGPAAVYAISTGEPTLRNLQRCGLLQHLLPEFGECRTLMPTDSVHTYTVFEHTLRAIRHLDRIPSSSFLADVRASINDLEPLYLALLLHDVGKVDRTQPHSQSGAEIARDICARWGLAPSVSETVEWLVREHLVMAMFIRVRDLQNPQTIEEFAEVVGNVQRLHMLTLLTWADINAVAEGAWTPAQEAFLRELHERTEARLMGDAPSAPDPTQYRLRLLRQLKSKPEDEEAVQAFVNSLPSYYLTSTPPDVVRLHMEFARKAVEGEPTVELFHRPDLGATEITVCTLDQPGLLSRLLGVLYAYDLSLSGIRASTTRSQPAIAVDVFTVSFSNRPVPPATAKQVVSALLDVISGRARVEDVLAQKGKDPSRKQNVFSYTYIPGTPGILEIRAPRGRGMPYRFSHQIAEQGWNVVSARVGQWAGNATAAFYLVGSDGQGLDPQVVQRALGHIAPASEGAGSELPVQ